MGWRLGWLGCPAPFAVGAAYVDAVLRVWRRVGRPVLDSDDLREATGEGGRRLGALVRREHVEALKVG